MQSALPDSGSKLTPGMESPQCLFFQCWSEKCSPIYGASHHIPICLREFMVTDMPSPPALPPSGSSGRQFNPLEKLVETNTCILCSIEGFLGGPLLLICAKYNQLYIAQCSNLLPAPRNSFGEKSLFWGEGWGFFLLLFLLHPIFSLCGVTFLDPVVGVQWISLSESSVSSCNGQMLHNQV